MNERGVISLTALFMMLILATTIATVKNVAARQTDIVRYYQVENELQAAAESAFNEVVANLSKNAECYGKFNNSNKKIIIPFEVLSKKSNRLIKVDVSLRKAVNSKKIVIKSLAELQNYNYVNYSIYRKIMGYMSVVSSEILSDNIEEGTEPVEKYEFTGYFY